MRRLPSYSTILSSNIFKKFSENFSFNSLCVVFRVTLLYFLRTFLKNSVKTFHLTPYASSSELLYDTFFEHFLKILVCYCMKFTFQKNIITKRYVELSISHRNSNQIKSNQIFIFLFITIQPDSDRCN